MSNFVFGTRSLKELATVHPTLRDLAHRALSISPVDFGITEGARSLAKQRKMVDTGKSRTMKSSHIKKEDGWAYAIDTAAYVQGAVNWDFANYVLIARAFAQALSDLHEVTPRPYPGAPLPRIRWGGSWEYLAPSGTPTPLVQHTEYIERMRRQKRTPLIDGVHFELHFI